MIVIEAPYRHTKLQIWYPKYSTQYMNLKEKVVLLAKYKVDKATSIMLVEFTKAQHLMGQRFAIRRGDVQSFPVVTNGKIETYEVPLSQFESWETERESLGEGSA